MAGAGRPRPLAGLCSPQPLPFWLNPERRKHLQWREQPPTRAGVPVLPKAISVEGSAVACLVLMSLVFSPHFFFFFCSPFHSLLRCMSSRGLGDGACKLKTAGAQVGLARQRGGGAGDPDSSLVAPGQMVLEVPAFVPRSSPQGKEELQRSSPFF